MTKERKRGLASHVSSDDYFGTLATVLDLLRQDWKGRVFSRKNDGLLLHLTDDLLYLQEHYVIHARESAKSADMQLVGKSLKKKLSEEDKKILDAAAQRLADILVMQIDEKNLRKRKAK
jgi:hypothetical protein